VAGLDELSLPQAIKTILNVITIKLTRCFIILFMMKDLYKVRISIKYGLNSVKIRYKIQDILAY